VPVPGGSPLAEWAIAVALFIVGLVLLERGADLAADAVGALARSLAAPLVLTGLLTVGLEWEELAVMLAAVAEGSPPLAAGNAIGAAVVNLAGVFGLAAVVRPVGVEPLDRRLAAAVAAAALLVVLLAADGTLSRPDGAILVAGFVLYTGLVATRLVRATLDRRAAARAAGVAVEDQGDGDDDGDDAPARRRPGPVAVLLVLSGLALTIVGADLVARGALRAVPLLGLPPFLVGLTALAIGTALPDQAVSIAAARKGFGGLVIANAIGSSCFTLLLALGLSVLAAPAEVGAQAAVDLAVLAFATVGFVVALMTARPTVGRPTGALLFGAYVAYVVATLAVRG
jgi:cation:H+ antiporter